MQNDANAQELAALKAVIHCVQDYKLEADYPLDPLQRRVAQLEKRSWPDKKRFGNSGIHQQFKKPRAKGSFHGYGASSAAATVVGRQAPPVFGERAYTGMSERSQHAVSNTYNYQAPTESAYGQPVYDQRRYYYPQDEWVAAPAYNSSTSSYGSHTGIGMSSSHQPYI